MPLQRLFQDALVGGKYRLGPVIGSGGVGTVYRATHLWTERHVAIKVLDPGLPHFAQLRDAFLREARASVQLDHPNVVDVLDMGEDDAHNTYLVMELLDGPTLRDVLLEQGRLSPDDTFAILLPLIDALIKAHELGIVHRDFKPENIILSVDAFEATTPKLLDFGVAQVMRETRARVLGAPDDVIVGTPQYMSPEQARDQRGMIGPHTDVWGVGVVWYECLTGHPPFDGESAIEVLTAVCEAPIDFSEVPESHVPILRDALERSPRKRIESLDALKDRIEAGGLIPPSTGTRAKVSSWPSSETRPSYVRHTLHGVGPTERVLSGPRPVQLDSELLSLPLTSHRKAMIGGVALALAVGFAAWWTIGGRIGRSPSLPPEDVPHAATSVSDQPELPAIDVGPREPIDLEAPVAEELESKQAEGLEPVAGSEPEPEPAEELRTPVEANAEQAGKRPQETADSTSKPSTPSSLRPARRRQSPPSGPTYDKPPELVTEW